MSTSSGTSQRPNVIFVCIAQPSWRGDKCGERASGVFGWTTSCQRRAGWAMVTSMRVRALGALVLLALVVGLVPLAYASPPDQTWLRGLYDDADYDDVIIALTSTVAASDATPTPEPRPSSEVCLTLRTPEPLSP